MASVQMMNDVNDHRDCDKVLMRDDNISPRSLEANLGMKVEDLWDVQESQLSPTEKLNAYFESIPVSAFPFALYSQGGFSFLGFH